MMYEKVTWKLKNGKIDRSSSFPLPGIWHDNKNWWVTVLNKHKLEARKPPKEQIHYCEIEEFLKSGLHSEALK